MGRFYLRSIFLLKEVINRLFKYLIKILFDIKKKPNSTELGFFFSGVYFCVMMLLYVCEVNKIIIAFGNL